jgi:putative salt-induced outer membrane protein YdiY
MRSFETAIHDQAEKKLMTATTRILLMASIMAFCCGPLQADVVSLNDGTRLVGTVERLTATEAVMSNTFAGNLSVPRDRIVRIETDAPVTVQIDDGAYLTGRLAGERDGALQIDIADAVRHDMPLTEVRDIYREDPQIVEQRRLAVRVTADANVGISLSSGNTDSENFHVDGRVITRTPKNRYTLTAAFTREESEGIKVKENWNGLVKYDHFVSDRWFLFNSASFESDEFKDLELRSAIAAGMGFQFFETGDRILSVELGPSYIDENFIEADDDSFLGARWSANFEQRLWNGLWFYHNQEGLLGLESTDDLTIRSRTGLRMNVTERIIARVQTAINWNKTPPSETDSTDVVHTVTLGYRF